jgi:hypothetical protein
MSDRHQVRRGMRDYLTDGWRLGGAAMDFVLRNRPLRRYLLGAVGVMVVVAAGVAVAAVALRRHAGPVEYALVGLGVSYALSLMVTAATVGLAGVVADCLDELPVTASRGWEVIRSRRRPIAAWAVLDTAVGVPSRAVGSYTIEQVGTLLLGFGWSLLSFFAIPTIALTGQSARATARHSIRLARGHWGDAVYSTVYLWIRAVVVFGIPSAAAAAAGVLLIRAGAEILGAALFAAGAAGLALTYLVAQGARAVITVVLYKFVSSGTVYPAFPAELLDRSVRGPSGLLRRAIKKIEGDRIRGVRRRVLGDLDELAREPGDPTAEEARREK